MINQQTILPDQSETVSIPRTTDRSAGGSPSALTSLRAGFAKAFSASCPSELIHTSEPLAGRALMLRKRQRGRRIAGPIAALGECSETAALLGRRLEVAEPYFSQILSL